MLLQFDAELNGVSLAHLDPAILLQDVEEEPADEDVETARRGLHAGTRLTHKVRRKLSIRLILNVREYNPIRRSDVMDKLSAWLGDGGWLRLSNRPNQRLYVHVDMPPAQRSALRWTENLEVVLTAYERPYWEQAYPTVAVITDSGVIIPTGTLPEAYVEVDAINVSDDELTEITLTCADTQITLTGLHVPANGHIIISYTDKDVMTITAGGESALANRTAESHDDLIARIRTANTISVTADQAVSAVFRARGRYR